MSDPATPPRRTECPRCLRPQRTCICSLAAHVPSDLALLILQHPQEVREAKGTGRLLHLSLPGSSLVAGETFDPTALHSLLFADERTPVLLYPPSGDMACERFAPGIHPASTIRLVLLDGTWRKSRKMLFCNPLLQSLPRLALDDLPASGYRIRKAHAPHQLASLEAAAAAIAALDPRANIRPLLDSFSAFVEQQAALAGC